METAMVPLTLALDEALKIIKQLERGLYDRENANRAMTELMEKIYESHAQSVEKTLERLAEGIDG
jgi:hypothetical protein